MAKDPSPATKQLHAHGIEFGVHEYAHDPNADSYGDEAVAALAVDSGRVFKTLVAQLDGAELVVAVVPVGFPLSLKALATASGAKKAAMAPVAAAERSSGYVAGGISPFGQRKPLRTFVDESANHFKTIFVSAGRRGVEVEVPAATFGTVLDATFAALAAHT